LKLEAFLKALSIAIIIDLAILILRKGIIKRSPKILATYLFFFVKAVGLIIELMTKSYNSRPSCFNAQILIFPNPLPSGNPRKGEVNITPDTFKKG
jgi:hypothetical protein